MRRGFVRGYDPFIVSGEKGMEMFGFRSFVVLFGALLAGMLSVFVLEKPASSAATLPAGFVEFRVVEGLSSPTAMALMPDGRILVTEQRGRLRVVEDGKLRSALDLSNVIDARGERGLLGVTVDPAFASNGHIYVYFTRKAAGDAPAHNRVMRFTLDGDRVAPGGGRLILRLNNLSRAMNHNGGAVHFGKDGKLYVAVGDNADGENAQSLKNLKGKMLRINKNGTIPTDNPFFEEASGKNRAIWAMGLRNPFSFAVQLESGVIFINDVGQKEWEEINRGRRGANYVWPAFEGPERNRRYVPPVFAYRHGESPSTGCAITGGDFHAPETRQFPEEYVGDYFFADFCGGWIRRYDPASGQVEPFARGLSFPVDLKMGPDGSLYYLERGSGTLSKIGYEGV